jgi:hypothetical protein
LCFEANRHLALEEIDDYLEAREGQMVCLSLEWMKTPLSLSVITLLCTGLKGVHRFDPGQNGQSQLV